jgi:predicted nucleic acid-binding protein
MSSKGNPARLLLDTSSVVHQLHGHTLQQAAVRNAVAGGEVLVPVFVRMEYLRGVILNLIEMWCLIRESVTVEDAFIDWSQKIRQERKLKIILMTVPRWLGSQEEPNSKEVVLRRLGDLVLRMLRDFDEAYPNPPDDPLACVLGRLDIASQGYDDDLLLDFYQRFTAVQEGVPDCKLCDFRKVQRQRLRRRKIDLASPEVRQQFASSPGFLRQAEQAEEAAHTKSRAPACSWCARLGDTLIALQAERGVAVVTADRTFVPLGELLGQLVIVLPSLAELKRRAQDA